MRITGVRALDGPNIHCYRPVVEMILDLEGYDARPTSEVKGFNDRLLAAFPALDTHHCSLGYPGGFVERLREGTLAGHVVEHLALELQVLAGSMVSYGKTRRGDRPGIYRVIYEYEVKEAALSAGQAAASLVFDLLEGRDVDPGAAVEGIRRLVGRHGLGPSTRAIVHAAAARDIPVMRLNDRSLIQLGYGRYQKRIQATMTGFTSCIGVDVAKDKTLAKRMLLEAGIPVPAGGVARTVEEAIALAHRVGYPVVIKPHNGNQGKGVTLNLTTDAEVRAAFSLALNYSDEIIVEKYIPGKHYRLLVVDGRVVAASRRIPAQVAGDGEHTIRELVEAVNADPRRGEGHERPLTRIKIDPVVLMVLARQGFTPDSVPPAGQVVMLRENANLSTGGTAVDAADGIHPDNLNLATRATRIIGLDVAGIDVVAESLSSPIRANGGAIIEVNAAPGIRMHHHPAEGQPRDAAGAIVDYLFPPGAPRRVPVVAVTGTNGKTTTTRMIAHILETHGLRVGMTTTDGVYIGGHCVLAGDTAGPRSARLVLQDPEVEAAVLETARGGIIRSGLAFDRCDVAVLTNIADDHLGQDGVESLEDLVHVKGLLLEVVAQDGFGILNADDPMVVQAASLLRGRPVYFSQEEDNLWVRVNLSEGGMGVYVKNGSLVLARGPQEKRLLPLRDIPATCQGRAAHNAQNALAAAAACLALGIAPATIRQGLSTFGTDPRQNQGRLELLERDGLRILVDYGHNAAAYEATLRTARQLGASRLIGVIAVPGDRRDDSIINLGRSAGRGFDYIVIKEDHDLRGRRPGEVAALLKRGVLEAGFPDEHLEIVSPEGAAVQRALSLAGDGDLVVIFYEKYLTVMEAIDRAVREGAGRRSLPLAEQSTG